jgi:hypothetical protein
MRDTYNVHFAHQNNNLVLEGGWEVYEVNGHPLDLVEEINCRELAYEDLCNEVEDEALRDALPGYTYEFFGPIYPPVDLGDL